MKTRTGFILLAVGVAVGLVTFLFTTQRGQKIRAIGKKQVLSATDKLATALGEAKEKVVGLKKDIWQKEGQNQLVAEDYS